MASITDRVSRPYVYFTIAGLGPATETAADSDPYLFTTRTPTDFAVTAGRWRPPLVDVPQEMESGFDLVTGATEVSGMAIDLVEGAGVVFFTELLATRERAKRGELAANATAAAATVDVTQVAGGVPVVNEVISIGDERMRVTAVAPGAGAGGSDRLTVTRAYYGTTARAHTTTALLGDGEVRYRAHYLRGRLVTMYLNFVGNLRAAEQVIRRFLLDRIELVDGTIWRLHLRGIEATLDTEIGTDAYSGWTQGIPEADFGHHILDNEAWRILVARVAIDADVPGGAGPWLPSVDSGNGGYFRIADGCVEFEADLEPVFDMQTYLITRWRVGETPLPASENRGELVREVLPTDPRLEHGRFAPVDILDTGLGVPSDHPIDIFLCLALSTGAGTNFVATHANNWDVLPAWAGAAIPIARFDIDAFEAMKVRLAGYRMPNLIVNWDGAFNFKEYAEQYILGPIGLAVMPNSSGLLRPVLVAELYAADTVTVLDADDVIPGSESWSWDSSRTVLAQHWEWDHAGPDGDPRQVTSVLTPAARARYRHESDRALDVEARGLAHWAGGAQVVSHRSSLIIRHFLEPAPTLTLRLNWLHALMQPGDLVRLTYAAIPNPVTGARGVTAEPYYVVRARMMLQDVVQGGGGGVEVELFQVGLGDETFVYVAPALRVAAGDAGVGVVVTVAENAFTAGVSFGTAVADDTDGVVAGGAGVGETVILCDPDGVLLSANTPRITAKTTTTITTSDVFRDGGGVEVPRVAGQIIVYTGDTGATSYTVSAWLTSMQVYAAHADAAGLTIGTTARLDSWGD